jgi:serine/threonine protein kinase
MGVVYLADDLVLGREVALKTLPYVSPLAEQRSRAEARMMAHAVHPNLAAIYGFEEWHGRPILVMEYLPGGTLADRLRICTLPVREVIDCGLALCDALVCLHGQTLVHGDIKPSNIGFDAAGTAKLLDFGLAGQICERSHAPERCRWATRAYQCPEAIDTDARRPAFDLWSLSAVLYEALAGPGVVGEQPWRGDRGDVRDVRSFRPDIPVEVAAILQRALDLRAEHRPASAGELSLWLHQIQPMH